MTKPETKRATQLTNEEIRDALLGFGATADGELSNAIRVYTETLLRWNQKISLTTVTDPAEIMRVHFAESFFAASVIEITDGRVADIGSGAGFPGVPIRMIKPAIRLTLVEPIAKKTAFLGEILRNLGITNADVIRCRIEDLPSDTAPFDLITARALGKYDRLLRESRARIAPKGSIMLLVGESDAKQIRSNQGWAWRDPVRVPASKARFILLGSPR